MSLFCIDVGNSHVHYGLVDGQQIIETGNFRTNSFRDGPSLEFAKRVADLLKQANGISFCSVVPAINENLKATLASPNIPLFQLTCNTCNGLRLTYPNPEEIGQDRLANAIAVQEFYDVPAIVIDMGTAVTFDIVTSQGYEGGIIAPGIKVMTGYLHEQAALLPEIDPKDLINIEGAIGKSTIHAMKLGIAIGFSGMIHALRKLLIDKLTEREGKTPVVLSTGGSIANLTKDWTEKSLVVENLTLIGLAVAFERSVQKAI